MIDVKWVEENIKDEEVKEFLVKIYVNEDSVEHETIQDLIDDIIGSENDMLDDIDFEDFESLDELVNYLSIVSKTLKILNTFAN